MSESVTVRDLITEQMRWDAVRPVFGPLPLPELTAYVDQLTQLDAVLLRIALANTAVPPIESDAGESALEHLKAFDRLFHGVITLAEGEAHQVIPVADVWGEGVAER
ncbi:MAG: hypothetical protein JWR78_399 [Mycobacterium sp.]|nr:hypothetical protein [Mycobacterium sp.]